MTMLLGAMALAICFAGYFLFIREKLGMPVEFIPAFTFSGVICVLFCAGILNFLPLANWLILLGGVACLVYMLVKMVMGKKLRQGLMAFCTPGMLFMLLAMVYLAYRFQGATLNTVDDFTHWGPMVKELYYFDRLPNFETRLIMHESYPPGSALFDYFIVKFLGFGESKMLLAQALLNVAYAGCLFAFVKGKVQKWFMAAMLAVVSLYVMIVPGWGGLKSLMVDNLLALCALATALVMVWYRNDVRRAALFSCPLLVANAQIKNTAILFVVFNVALLVYLLVCQLRKTPGPERRRLGISVLLPAAMPFLATFLWSSHLGAVYANAAESRHSMNPSYLWHVFQDRDMDTWGRLTKLFFSQAFSQKYNATLPVLVLSVALVVALAVLAWQSNPSLGRRGLLVAAAMAGQYLVFMLGLLGNYLLTSGYYDIVDHFPDFDRYWSSPTVYLCGLAAMYMVVALGRDSKLPLRLAAWALSVSWVGYLAVTGKPLRKFRPIFYSESPGISTGEDLATTVRNYGYEPLDYKYSYVLYIGSLADGSIRLLPISFMYESRYALMSNNTLLLSETDDLEPVKDQLEDWYFLLIAEEDENIRSFLADYGITGELEPFYLVEDILSGKAAADAAAKAAG